VFADKRLVGPSGTITDDLSKFAINSGFNDSLAVIRKIGCLNFDHGRVELAREIMLKLQDNRPIDLARDYKKILEEPAKEEAKRP
jgi:hypothetical protein